jgi:hypothetical protein
MLNSQYSLNSVEPKMSMSVLDCNCFYAKEALLPSVVDFLKRSNRPSSDAILGYESYQGLPLHKAEFNTYACTALMGSQTSTNCVYVCVSSWLFDGAANFYTIHV